MSSSRKRTEVPCSSESYLCRDLGPLEDHLRQMQHPVPMLNELVGVPLEEPPPVVAVEVAPVAEEARVLGLAVVLACSKEEEGFV
jgi:hypothetical protein